MLLGAEPVRADHRAMRKPLFVPKKDVDPSFAHIYPQIMQVSLKYAQEHLADLVSAANRGEDVEIAAPDQPPVRLMLVVSNASVSDAPRPPREPGRLKGLIQVPGDEEWAAMDKELEDMMVHAPLTTDGDI